MVNKGAFLKTGEFLRAGDYIVSNNGIYYAIMQDDGNFCVYPGPGPENRQGERVWCSIKKSLNRGQYYAIMQDDGNFCVYPGPGPENRQGEGVWCSIKKSDDLPIPTPNPLTHGLTVLTYNTHLFGGSLPGFIGQFIRKIKYEDKKRRIEIVEKIKEVDADIIALQEVWASSWQKWFTDRLKRNYPHSYHTNKECGLVLLSKYAFKFKPTFKVFTVQSEKDEEKLASKGVITAIVEPWPDGPAFRVGATHTNTDTVKTNLSDIVDLVKWTIIDETPAIMMGDFNVHCGGDYSTEEGEYGRMKEIFERSKASDAYRDANNGEVNAITNDPINNSLHKMFFPNLEEKPNCIDYVFYRKSGNGLTLKPESAKVFTDWKYPVKNPIKDLSDHYPLLVKFSVTRE